MMACSYAPVLYPKKETLAPRVSRLTTRRPDTKEASLAMSLTLENAASSPSATKSKDRRLWSMMFWETAGSDVYVELKQKCYAA